MTSQLLFAYTCFCVKLVAHTPLCEKACSVWDKACHFNFQMREKMFFDLSVHTLGRTVNKKEQAFDPRNMPCQRQFKWITLSSFILNPISSSNCASCDLRLTASFAQSTLFLPGHLPTARKPARNPSSAKTNRKPFFCFSSAWIMCFSAPLPSKKCLEEKDVVLIPVWSLKAKPHLAGEWRRFFVAL